jgi:hypothetical protein
MDGRRSRVERSGSRSPGSARSRLTARFVRAGVVQSGVRCPFCGKVEDRVVDSREAAT